jgi:carbon-monoxide dehydrogenase catalytic subunit
VLGGPAVTQLLTDGAEGVIGAKFAVEPDPVKAAGLILQHIQKKREALGIG